MVLKIIVVASYSYVMLIVDARRAQYIADAVAPLHRAPCRHGRKLLLRHRRYRVGLTDLTPSQEHFGRGGSVAAVRVRVRRLSSHHFKARKI